PARSRRTGSRGRAPTRPPTPSGRRSTVRRRTCRGRSSSAREPLRSREQLFGLRRRVRLVTRSERTGDAVAHVAVEDLERERFERGVGRRDLREDVDAVAVVVDHPLDAADLALDAVQALDERLLVLRVSVAHGNSRYPIWV